MKPNASAAAVIVILLLAGVIFFLRARNPEGFNKLVGDVTSLVSPSSAPAPETSPTGPAGEHKKKKAGEMTATTPPQTLPAKLAHPATAAIDKANRQANAAINIVQPTPAPATRPASARAPVAPAPATPAPLPPVSAPPASPTEVGGIASQASSDTLNIPAPSTSSPSAPTPQSDSAASAGPVGTPEIAAAAAAPPWTPPAKIPAQPNWTWTTTDGHTYNNVKVLKMEPDHVTILNSQGGAQVMLATLPPDLQKLFNYDPAAAAQWAVPSLLEGNLVVGKNGVEQPVDDAILPSIKYYAIYYSASWCKPCEAFTPTLVTFYKNFKPSHPDFEVIFISEDTNVAAMDQYMRTAHMPWPAFRYDELVHPPGQFKGPGIEAYANKGIPDLVLVDSTGQVLSDSYHGDHYVGPAAVIEDIKTMVK